MKFNTKKTSHIFSALHIFSLFGIAVAQPLFDQLSRHPEVLVSWHLKPLDIVMLICLLSALLPLSIYAIYAFSKVFGKFVHNIIYATIISWLLDAPDVKSPR